MPVVRAHSLRPFAAAAARAKAAAIAATAAHPMPFAGMHERDLAHPGIKRAGFLRDADHVAALGRSLQLAICVQIRRHSVDNA